MKKKPYEDLIVEPEVTDEIIREAFIEISNQMALQYLNDPDSMDDFAEDVMVVLETEGYLDALVKEQRWIWGTLYPAMLKVNRVVDDYKAQRKNADLERIPTKDDLIFLEESYFEPWFSDFCENLEKRANVFEQTLDQDIELVLHKLSAALAPEWFKDTTFGKLLIKPSTVKMILENPEFLIKWELRAQHKKDQN